MTRKLFALGFLGVVVIAAGVALLPSCGDECLAYGENCTSAYKEREYGTTSIGCCEGTCSEGSGNGVLVCH